MSEHVIHALQDHLKALIRANEAATVELRRVLGPLEKLPELSRMQAEAIEKAVSAHTAAVARMEVASLIADMRSFETTGAAQRLLAEGVADDLQHEIDEVEARYAKLQAELDTLASDRVAALDAAALELIEEDLQRVRDSYTNSLIPSLEFLSEEARAASALRSHGLREIAINLERTLSEVAGSKSVDVPADFLSKDVAPDIEQATLETAHLQIETRSTVKHRRWFVFPTAKEDVRLWELSLEPFFASLVPEALEKKEDPQFTSILVGAVIKKVTAMVPSLSRRQTAELEAKLSESISAYTLSLPGESS